MGLRTYTLLPFLLYRGGDWGIRRFASGRVGGSNPCLGTVENVVSLAACPAPGHLALEKDHGPGGRTWEHWEAPSCASEPVEVGTVKSHSQPSTRVQTHAERELQLCLALPPATLQQGHQCTVWTRQSPTTLRGPLPLRISRAGWGPAFRREKRKKKNYKLKKGQETQKNGKQIWISTPQKKIYKWPISIDGLPVSLVTRKMLNKTAMSYLPEHLKFII
jgi:hypothetical protein